MRRRAYLSLVATGLAGCSTIDRSNEPCPIDPDVNPGTGNWPTPTGDQRNTRSVPHGDAPEPPLTIDWLHRSGGHVGVPAPTVRNGVLYTSDLHSTLYALDAGSGDQIWGADVGDVNTPIVTDERIVASNSDGHPTAHSTADGSRHWQTSVANGHPGLFAPPTVADGTALFPTYLGLTALDLETGDERWHHDVGLPVVHRPIVVDGTVYATAADAVVHALDPETGERRWQYRADAAVRTPPTVVDGTLYAASEQSVLAVDLSTREQLWSLPVDVRPERIGADGGHVYVGGDSELVAVEATSGTECWRQSAFEAGYAGGFAAGRDFLYATINDGRGIEDQTIAALDPTTGTIEWRYGERRGRLSSGPAVVDGAVYVGGSFRETGLATVRLS